MLRVGLDEKTRLQGRLQERLTEIRYRHMMTL